MAPLRPSARELRAQRISGAIPPLAPRKAFRPSAATSDSFLSSKVDKRIIKRSILISRARESSSSGMSKKKRSRKPKAPSTRIDSLAAGGLGGLVDALPELEADEVPDGKVHHRSLKSKRGALRRKERVVRGEMERFGASMASLATLPAAVTTTTIASGVEKKGGETAGGEEQGRADKWAALRGFIASSMKQNPAFEK